MKNKISQHVKAPSLTDSCQKEIIGGQPWSFNAPASFCPSCGDPYTPDEWVRGTPMGVYSYSCSNCGSKLEVLSNPEVNK